MIGFCREFLSALAVALVPLELGYALANAVALGVCGHHSRRHRRLDARHGAILNTNRLGGLLHTLSRRRTGAADHTTISFLNAAADPTLMPAANAAARML
jgi:hypothetical protein